MMPVTRLRYLSGLLLLAGAACQTAPSAPTAYQPATDGYGYTETKTDDGIFEVSFQGNEATPYPVVENYLLYRAAELAEAEGKERFAVLRPSDTRVQIQQRGDHAVCAYSPAEFSEFVYYPGANADIEPQAPAANVSYRATIRVSLDDLPAGDGGDGQLVFRTAQTLDYLSSCMAAPSG